MHVCVDCATQAPESTEITVLAVSRYAGNSCKKLFDFERGENERIVESSNCILVRRSSEEWSRTELHDHGNRMMTGREDQDGERRFCFYRVPRVLEHDWPPPPLIDLESICMEQEDVHFPEERRNS